MTVESYMNNSAENVINKNIVLVATTTGILRNDSDVLTPEIIVDGDIQSFINNVNYVRVVEFNRFYYLKSFNLNNKQIFTLTLECDVLYSFRAYIRQNSGIIARNANSWNLYLNDNLIKCYQNPYKQTVTFPYTFNTFSNVLVMAGG